MELPQQNASGLKRLVERYRDEFRRPENTKYYSDEDYRLAEKKFIRFCLAGDPRYKEAVLRSPE